MKYFMPIAKDMHLILIGGDIYDQLLSVNSQAYFWASTFLYDLIVLSSTTGAQVRFLHGTYSHDRSQLDVINTYKYPNSRVGVVSNIAVEELHDFRCNDRVDKDTTIRIGYLPDNLAYRSSASALGHLKQEMDLKGWTMLDALLGHGNLDYTLPSSALLTNPVVYTTEQLRQLVVGPIFMGHVHTHSNVDGITYTGSFDRFAHNEEDPKGFYTFEYKDNTTWKYTFHENLDATLFKSITIDPVDPEDVYDVLKRKIDHAFPSEKDGYVRVLSPSSDVRSIARQLVVDHYPNLTVTTKASSYISEDKLLPREKHNLTSMLDALASLSRQDLNPDHLPELVIANLEERNLLKDISQQEMREAVKSILST